MQQSQVPPPSSLSVLQQTLQAIEQRVRFFSTENYSAQNCLHPNQSLSVRSISEIVTPLKFFHVGETPLSMALNAVYASTYLVSVDEETKGVFKWNITPASEGEDSINEEEVFQPTFKWLTSAMIDPNLLVVDQPEPIKIERHKIPEDWVPITSILLFNVSKKVHLKSEMQAIESMIKKKFNERYWWLKFKRAKQIYFRGKPSIILKFSDPNSAGFLYFHYASYKSNRDEFGENCEVFRVVKDNTKEYEKQKNWILLFFRHLPLAMTKQQLMGIININGAVKWIDEMIEIEGAKYMCCKVGYLDEALHVCELFNSRKIKDAKVNIHPKSSKNWKSEEVQEQIVEENPESQKAQDLNQSY